MPTDHLAALTGALVFALLPGAALIRWEADDPLEDLGTACALSIGLNSFLVLALFLAGWYNAWTAWGWALALAGGSIALWRRGTRLRTAVGDFQRRTPKRMLALGAPLLLLPLLAIAFYKAAFLPFYSHDAVASWNRWALEMVLDPVRIQAGKVFYPLFNSAGMSFPYQLSGNTEIQYYSHSLSFAHLAILYAAVRQWARMLGFSVVVVVAGLFLSHLLYYGAGTGYADVGSAAFGAWAVILYLQALEGQRGPNAAWLAGLAAASAYLFKPSALPMAVLIPALSFLFVPRQDFRRRFWLGAKVAAGLALAPLLWNVVGGHPLTGPQFDYVMGGIHGDSTRWEVMQAGWRNLVSSATFYESSDVDELILALAFVFLAAGMALGNAKHRVLGGAALLNVLIWMATANYNLRGAFLAILAWACVAASGLDALLGRLAKSYRPAATVAAQLVLVGGVLYGEYLGADRDLRAKKLEWREGRAWLSTRPWQSADEKRAILDGNLRDLQAWRADHPGFKGLVWTTPKLKGALLAQGIPALWIEVVDRERLRWKPGDHLFASNSFLSGRKKSHLLLHTPGGESQTWGEWAGRMVEQGRLRKIGEYGRHQAYEVLPPEKGDE